MIKVQNLYKKYHNHYGSKWVLRDVSFTIPKGVSVGLLGCNGGGKSTLLRLIANMDHPNRGEIIRNCRVSWPIGLSGGFQGSMTGRQNVKFVARIHGAGDDIERIVSFVSDFSEIGSAFDEPVRSYSSGMKSRLAFGLSLAFDFDVYLSDEATAVGDIAFKEKAKKAFMDRVGKAGLIMVSHSEGILKELCQSGIWLHEGQAFWYDDIDDAIHDYHDCMGIEKQNSSRQDAKTKQLQAVREKNKFLKERQLVLRTKINELRERQKILREMNQSLRNDNKALFSKFKELSKKYKKNI